MYKVYCDDFKIYDYQLEDYKIFNAKLELELNKTGTFTFTIYPNNINYGVLQKMKSIITVYQDDYLIFRGRILNDEEGFYNEKQVTCEGELAFLLDSFMHPYGSTSTPWTGTPEEYLTMLINNHNAHVNADHQFVNGTVTVTEGDTSNNANQISRSDSDYVCTWDLIQNKLVSSLGGYLWVDYDGNGNRRINYLADFDTISNQTIEFGKNLLDITKSIKGEDVATAIIPLGAKLESTEKRLTICDIADAETSTSGIFKQDEYVYDQAAVNQYGWIFKTVVFDDVTEDTEYLKNQGIKALTESTNLNVTIELTSADLSGIEDVNPFRLGRYIIVKDDKHGLDTLNSDLRFLVNKLSIDLLKPSNNTLTIGTTYTFTATTSNSNATQNNIVERVESIESKVSEGTITQHDLDNAIAQVNETTSSKIDQSSDSIMTSVATDYYLKDDANADKNELVESMNTKFTQTNSEFNLRFNQFSQDLQDMASANDEQFQEISKYIRFVDGNIILGEDGNVLTLKIQNDRIAFLESGVEVAYFSERKLYVLDGEFINSLKLGKYAFIPRENGNLSFKKVVN